MQEHEIKDGFKLWLSEQEVTSLLDQAIHPKARIAFGLAARSGLRSHEITEVYPENIVDTDAGSMIRVEHGKGDKFRETPIPPELKTTIETAVEFREQGVNEPVILNTKGNSCSTRTLRNWLTETREKLADRGQDKYWNEMRLICMT
ncbi:tyrosine-type recombinase/integrase [Haloquadratum walsbyi]|uniref:tyrosine-type recombinase/integrase n=1 Tax=Haloquadratum walsbyi TaxID=293091 RepID=UPI0026EB7713|nr:tyrosine-type recombinase/integrase [Haloquadratum walsbyi]